MYSAILLVAMSGPAEVPSFGRLFHGGCSGCTGSCTGCTGTCTGYSCGGSCYGTYAAGYSCGGYSCGGYSCGGCGGGTGFCGIFRRGGCYGCTGYKTQFACHGAGACYGYAYAGISYGFAGCYGSCYGSYTNYFSYWQQPIDVHYGYGMPMHVAPGMAAPADPRLINPEPPVKNPKAAPANPAVPADPKKPVVGGIFESAPASVVVTLPADATLFANGVRTQQTSGTRQFVTPDLDAGKRFHYVFTAEVTRGGEQIRETLQVEVTPGGESRVTFAKLLAATPAAEPANIASAK